uniref:N-acetyltransferase domain-containing protein n=1 Tax=Magnetococcus massalia (strain MO-1) TaxID=451514 RepID=A0A1S7LHW1_MAGMO|nr:Protein of unknown function [Candidatus Magnetococcus massalia]
MEIIHWLPKEQPERGEAIHATYMAIWNAPENLRFLSRTGKPFTEAQVWLWLEQHDSQGGAFIYAWDASKQEVIGVAISMLDAMHGASLLGIGVLPTHRNQGVGQGLIDATLIHATKKEFHQLEAEVFCDNPEMLRLLLKLNFTPVEMRYHQRYDGTDSLRLIHPLSI